MVRILTAPSSVRSVHSASSSSALVVVARSAAAVAAAVLAALVDPNAKHCTYATEASQRDIDNTTTSDLMMPTLEPLCPIRRRPHDECESSNRGVVRGPFIFPSLNFCLLSVQSRHILYHFVLSVPGRIFRRQNISARLPSLLQHPPLVYSKKRNISILRFNFSFVNQTTSDSSQRADKSSNCSLTTHSPLPSNHSY